MVFSQLVFILNTCNLLSPFFRLFLCLTDKILFKFGHIQNHKSLMFPRTFKEYFSQFRHTMAIFPGTGRFFKKYRLWEGNWDQKWLSRVLMLIAMVVGIKMLSTFVDWWTNAHFDSLSATVSQMGTLVSNVFEGGFSLFYASGLKYVMFMLLYVATAHFSNQTLSILTHTEASKVTFKTTVDAHIRAFKVYMRCWILEMIISSVLLGVFFGIFSSIDFLETPMIFLVSCYFAGFAVVDSYNEAFGLDIKESLRYTQNYIGIAMATGLVAQVLLPIPLLGPILMPIVTGIAATIAMYELSDLHLVGSQVAAELDELV